jgi:hypothetical protein
MVLVPGSKESEAGMMPPKELFEAMGKFNAEMVKAGVMLAGEGLAPTSRGARIRYQDGKTTVTDGPFTESKELVAGFWIIQCKSKEEAVEWMKRAPFGGGVQVEIRQIMELADFPPDALPAGLAEDEAAMRAQIQKQAKK